MKKYITGSFLLLSLLLVAGCSGGAPNAGVSEEAAVKVAQCLKEKGTQMYGAFWCPHCAEQKRVFGTKATAEIPYIECDPKGDNPVTEKCLELKIEKYPTWIFPDGTRTTGVMHLKDLAEKSGCEAPVEAVESN